MKTNDITAGIKARLSAGTALPIAWPNVTPPDATTYGDFSFASVRREGGTLAGNEVLHEVGAFQVAIATPEGGGVKTAEDLADEIADIFLEGDRFAITGGTITITEPAQIKEGFGVQGEWRVPVVVSYLANRDN